MEQKIHTCQVICSCTDGYFLPETTEEKMRFYNAMRCRIRSAWRAIRALKGLPDELEGQLSIYDLIEDIETSVLPEN